MIIGRSMFRKAVSVTMLTLLLIGIFLSPINIKTAKSTWTGTVYIRADGSIKPPDAPITTYDNITYTLTDDITSSGDGLIVERDNIIIDGKDFLINGTRTCDSRGIALIRTKNVTVKNIHVNDFYYGIYLSQSSNNLIYRNNVTKNYLGVYVSSFSNGNRIVENTVISNSWGIAVSCSFNNTVSHNDLAANRHGIIIEAKAANNLISENILRWFHEEAIWLFYSSNNLVIRNMITEFTFSGIEIFRSSNNTISENNATSIWLRYSRHNLITKNNASLIRLEKSSENYIYENLLRGGGMIVEASYDNLVVDNLVNDKPLIYLEDIFNVSISGLAGQVILVNCSYVKVENVSIERIKYGIQLWKTRNSVIKGNNVTKCNRGILLLHSINNEIIGNNITRNYSGIYISASLNNTISKNDITDNKYGIRFWHRHENSYHNRIYHNNISNNDVGIKLFASHYNFLFENNLSNNGLGTSLDHSLNNNVIKNRIVRNVAGILIKYSRNNNVSANNVLFTFRGISLFSSENNTLLANKLIENNISGIDLYQSSSNYIIGNVFIRSGIWTNSHGNIVKNNTVNGKPLIYLENAVNATVHNAGQVILINCKRIRVENLNLSMTTIGIQLDNTINSIITGNYIANNHIGISLHSSINNSIIRNTVAANRRLGMALLKNSSNNKIIENNITNNQYGIYFYESSDNSVYHNNFINNTVQVDDPSWRYPEYYALSINIWDNGYPSGGNYWSDYNGTDYYSGPYQNETGKDGIGDTPYTINGDDVDRYPLVYPWGLTPPAFANVTVDIHLPALNLRSKGQWVIVFIELPSYNLKGINVSSIMLNGTIPVNLSAPIAIGDYDNDTVPDFMVCFDWTDVTNYILSKGIVFGNVTLEISGKLYNGIVFTGTDIILISSLIGDVNIDGKVDIEDIYKAAMAFGSYPTHPRWNPNADFTKDSYIGIDDIYLTARNFGKQA